MKTIIITSFHPFISRNILNTDVLKILRGQADLIIVLLVPGEKADFFKEYFAAPNVVIESFNQAPIQASRLNKFFHDAAFLLIKSHNIQWVRRDRLKAQPTVSAKLKFVIKNILTAWLAKPKWGRTIFRFIDNLFTPSGFYQTYLDKYQPAAVFTTDVFNDYDQLLIKNCKSSAVPVVGMIRSWDNNYSKGLCRFIPDKTIVNNETIKAEAIKLHGFKAEDIFVGGIPQFDDYLKAPFLSREEFFKKIGGDPAKKMILISPAGYPLAPLAEETGMCRMLKAAQDQGEIDQGIQFLIRSHPHRPMPIKEFSGVKNFIVESHSATSQTQSKGAEFTPQDKLHLVDSIYYADIVIWAATTLGIDSLTLDKPQIMINFDGLGERNYWDSVRRFHDEEHMKKFLATGAVLVANNRAELVSQINRYLENPKLLAAERKAAVAQQLWKNDGKAGERIGSFLLEFIPHLHSREGEGSGTIS